MKSQSRLISAALCLLGCNLGLVASARSEQGRDIRGGFAIAQLFSLGSRAGDVTPRPSSEPEQQIRKRTTAIVPHRDAKPPLPSKRTAQASKPNRPTNSVAKMKSPPLPPPRPGDLDDQAEPVSLAAQQHQSPSPVADETNMAVEPVKPEAAPTTHVLQNNILLLVRPGIDAPKDLDGSKIVVWREKERFDEVRLILEKVAGATLATSGDDFPSVLAMLANGDVDAILVGVGPKLSESDAEKLQLKPFGLVEIPL